MRLLRAPELGLLLLQALPVCSVNSGAWRCGRRKVAAAHLLGTAARRCCTPRALHMISFLEGMHASDSAAAGKHTLAVLVKGHQYSCLFVSSSFETSTANHTVPSAPHALTIDCPCGIL